MGDILDEIKHEFQEKKINTFFEKSTLVLIVLGIIVISFLSFKSLYDYYYNAEVYSDGVKLTTYVNQINTQSSKNLSELELLAGSSKNSYGGLSNFYLASLAIKQNNFNKAIYYYQYIAENSSYDSVMKQFALLSELNLRIKQQNYNADKIFELIGNGCYSKPFTIPASYLLFSFSKDKNQNTQVLSNLKSCVNEGHVDHITGLLSIYLKQNNLIE